MVGKAKYQVDQNYFDQIDTPQKAYWLGALWADGSVYKRPNRADSWVLSLEVKIDDINWLRQFAQEIKSDHPIRITHNKQAAKIEINSKVVCKQLVAHGVIPRKSYADTMPQVPSEYCSSFIHGVFDGDGWISPPTAGVCGNECVIRYIQNVLGFGSCFKRKDKNNLWQLSISGTNRLKQLYRFLYQQDTPYLARKRQKFDKEVYHRA